MTEVTEADGIVQIKECDYFKNINTNDPKENGEYGEKQKILLAKDIGTDFNYKREIVWRNVFLMATLHYLGLWGFYILCTGGIALKSFVCGKYTFSSSIIILLPLFLIWRSIHPCQPSIQIIY